MGLFGFIGDVVKKKVAVPQFKTVSPSGVESQAIKDYTAGFDEAAKYTRMVNAENQAAVDAQYAAKIPGFSEIDRKVAQNIASQLSGELPQDVTDFVRRQSASRAVAGGYGGSEFGANLTARDLGLTSLQLSQQGLGNAMAWISNIKQNRLAPSMNPGSLFISPEARLNLAVSERDKQMTRDYLSNQLRAAQSWRTSMGNQLNNFDQLLTSVAASYAGMALGGIGGAGGMFGGSMGGTPSPSQAVAMRSVQNNVGSFPAF